MHPASLGLAATICKCSGSEPAKIARNRQDPRWTISSGELTTIYGVNLRMSPEVGAPNSHTGDTRCLEGPNVL